MDSRLIFLYSYILYIFSSNESTSNTSKRSAHLSKSMIHKNKPSYSIVHPSGQNRRKKQSLGVYF